MNDTRLRLINSAETGHRRVGQHDLLKHLHGKRITQRQAIRAKCYDCNGMGELDTCDIETCPLFPYSSMKKISTGHPTASQGAKVGHPVGGMSKGSKNEN